MFHLHLITNTVNGKLYYGMTVNTKHRIATHCSRARNGSMTPLHCAIRKYGWDKFTFSIVQTFETKKLVQQAEINAIAKNTRPNYNLHPGGEGGFSMLTKSAEEILEWRRKQRESRKGKTPALGMKHTDETKAICGAYGKLRWDKYGRYPKEEILKLGFTEANKKFKISKTHYYRLKKEI